MQDKRDWYSFYFCLTHTECCALELQTGLQLLSRGRRVDEVDQESDGWSLFIIIQTFIAHFGSNSSLRADWAGL